MKQISFKPAFVGVTVGVATFGLGIGVVAMANAADQGVKPSSAVGLGIVQDKENPDFDPNAVMPTLEVQDKESPDFDPNAVMPTSEVQDKESPDFDPNAVMPTLEVQDKESPDFDPNAVMPTLEVQDKESPDFDPNAVMPTLEVQKDNEAGGDPVNEATSDDAIVADGAKRQLANTGVSAVLPVLGGAGALMTAVGGGLMWWKRRLS